ncbi:MAG: DNA-processing protein DprA, partial [Acidobacteriota bacterium]|nr:DNA-processing protein DprA [Acidobacteriota bacterium]
MDTVRLGSSCFPQLLTEIPNPPAILWFRGDLSICDKIVVAIVGARAASRAGTAAAEALAGDLARAGIVVASGLARGIDAAAHAGALDAGGTTIAVLGTG